jgi:hypothetical protein
VSVDAGYGLTAHDTWVPASTQRYISSTYVSPWISMGLRGHQNVPSNIRRAEDRRPTSPNAPGFITTHIATTLPDYQLWKENKPWLPSSFTLGHQLKWPLAGGKPQFDCK